MRPKSKNHLGSRMDAYSEYNERLQTMQWMEKEDPSLEDLLLRKMALVNK